MKGDVDMSENICRNCGAELLPGAKFCSKCRAAVEVPAAETCRACGAQLLPGARFCSKCRTSVENSGYEGAQPVLSMTAGKKKSMTRTVSIILTAACIVLAALCAVIIPKRIKEVSKQEEPEEYIVAGDELTDEQIEEYQRINAAVDNDTLFEEVTEGETIMNYEDAVGYYEWMNRDESEVDEDD